jgi:metal-sulfur cluster biosynthetic enzyme
VPDADPRDAAVRAVLARLDDPCSVAAGRPLSLLEMGLVLGWEWRDDDRLHVRLCVTSPGCTLAPRFVEAARRELAALPGIGAVEVVIDATHLWTPPAAAARPVTRPRSVRPQAWRDAAPRER